MGISARWFTPMIKFLAYILSEIISRGVLARKEKMFKIFRGLNICSVAARPVFQSGLAQSSVSGPSRIDASIYTYLGIVNSRLHPVANHSQADWYC